MGRRTFLAGSGAVFLAAPRAAEAQKSEKMARVGILGIGSAPSPEELAKSVSTNPLWVSMRQLGWVDGKNMVVERRFGESAEQLRAGAADLVRLKVDVLYVASAGLAKILQLETKTIPIVVASTGGDLVAAGLVDSLARPGGNIRGTQFLNDDLIPKRLELLKALVPSLSKAAFLHEDATFSAVPQMRARYDQLAAIAARALGIELHAFIVHRAGEFAAAFAGMMKNRDQSVLVMSSPFMFVHRKEIVERAAAHRIAVIYENRQFIEPGGLMSYGVNSPEMSRRSAVYLDKILRGAKPGDLPMEQPTKFELVINLKTAKALGLVISQSLLARADEVTSVTTRLACIGTQAGASRAAPAKGLAPPLSSDSPEARGAYMLPSHTRAAGARRPAARPRDVALRRWLASTPMIVAFLMVACSTVTNTPAQDEAWRRWTACSSQVPGADIRNVQLDGRIMFWANGAFQGRSMLDCLARAGTNGPALPEATYATRPGGA